jgi:V-type H+-transporting ATPase subunit F
VSTIEAAFQEFTERKDIAILLINQHVGDANRSRSSSQSGLQIAEKIRPTVDRYQQAFPALLEIPSKDHPYGAPKHPFLSVSDVPQDPSKDSVLKRVQKLFGE